MTIQEDLKKQLSGSIDDRLEVIERYTKERLSELLGVSEVPQEKSYISYEVTLKRFNRIGQEGMESFSQEGLSMTFPDSDFAEYSKEISDWKKEHDEEKKRGRFRLY